MAGTANPVSTPNAYSSPNVSRGSTLISELNIINETNHLEFFKKWGFNPYMLMVALGGGKLRIKSKDTKNKKFYHYEDFGRAMGYVTAAANFTSGGVNTPTTVTITTGSYSASGSRMLPAVNLVIYNAQTGVESVVTAVNTATPFAFTFTMIPVVAGTDSAGLAGQELQSRGYKYLGEASTSTTPQVRNIGKYTNYCSQHRMDSIITDLAKMESTDLIFEGQNYYMLKMKRDDRDRWIQEAEMYLLDSNLATNLTIDSGTLGLKQWIYQYGINIIYPSFNIQSTFADIERKLDAQAAPMSADWIQDTDQNIDFNQSLGNEFTNGAIIYDMDNLRRGFKKYTPMFREFSVTKYVPISDRTFYGSVAAGNLNSNTGYIVPTGKRDMSGDMNKDDMPQLIKRFQLINGQNVFAWDTGALSANGKTDKVQLEISQIEYPGLTVLGANQFIHISKG
jgi:hypothetical protein